MVVKQGNIADLVVELRPYGHGLFLPDGFVFGLGEDLYTLVLEHLDEVGFHFGNHLAVVFGGETSAFEDGLLHVRGLLLEPRGVHDDGADPHLIMDFGDVLLHFLELVGSEHGVGVFLSVDDLLLEGVERLVPTPWARVRRPTRGRWRS